MAAELPPIARDIVELECGHPLMILPYDQFRSWQSLPGYGPWTDAPKRDQMVCKICDAWRKVIGPMPRVLEVTSCP